MTIIIKSSRGVSVRRLMKGCFGAREGRVLEWPDGRQTLTPELGTHIQDLSSLRLYPVTLSHTLC